MREGDILAGKYVVERVLGIGGMGVVVAAHHRQLGGRVALKFMLPELATSGHVVRRFMREARAASSITSEHVGRVSDVGTLERGEPYIVMEYLEGHDLAHELGRNGPLPVALTVDYVMQSLQAIAEAHTKGIVHRDLKPSNLFVTRRADGSPLVKVLDFGIAKARPASVEAAGVTLDSTGAMPFVGSPCYVSPEQIRTPKDVDGRTDIWAVGVVLYELLTGRVPFLAEDLGGVVAAVLTEAPVPIRQRRPEVPAGLERVVMACLEKEFERRTPSVADLAAGLAPFGTAESKLSLARVLGITGGAPPPRRVVRARANLPAVLIGVLATGAVVLMLTWHLKSERPGSHRSITTAAGTASRSMPLAPVGNPPQQPALSPVPTAAGPPPVPSAQPPRPGEGTTPAPHGPARPSVHTKRHSTAATGPDAHRAPADLSDLIKDRK